MNVRRIRKRGKISFTGNKLTYKVEFLILSIEKVDQNEALGSRDFGTFNIS